MLHAFNKENLQVINLDYPILSLFSQNLGSAYISTLSQFIGKGAKIKVLNLGENKIDDAAIPFIVRYLILNPKVALEALDLGGNEITEEGAKRLMNALKINRTLTKLFLAGNPDISENTLEQIKLLIEKNREKATRFSKEII